MDDITLTCSSQVHTYVQPELNIHKLHYGGFFPDLVCVLHLYEASVC